MYQDIEEIQNTLESDSIHLLSIEEIENILPAFLKNKKQKEQDIIDTLILQDNNLTINHEMFKTFLQVSFFNFPFLIFFDQQLRVKPQNDIIDFNQLNSFNQSFQALESFINENRETIIFLFQNIIPNYKITVLKNKINSLIIQRKKDFIENIICSSITPELLKEQIPEQIFSIFINDNEEIKFKPHHIKIELSLYSRKKIQYLLDHDYFEDVNFYNKTVYEIDTIFEKEIKARLSNSTTQSYFSDPIDYKNHVEERTKIIIERFDRYKSSKEEIKISIDNSTYKNINEFKNLKFLSKDDKFLSVHDIKLLPNDIQKLYEYCSIKQNIKDF